MAADDDNPTPIKGDQALDRPDKPTEVPKEKVDKHGVSKKAEKEKKEKQSEDSNYPSVEEAEAEIAKLFKKNNKKPKDIINQAARSSEFNLSSVSNLFSSSRSVTKVPAWFTRNVTMSGIMKLHEFHKTTHTRYMRKNLSLAYKRTSLLKEIGTSLKTMNKRLLKKADAIKVNTGVGADETRKMVDTAPGSGFSPFGIVKDFIKDGLISKGKKTLGAILAGKSLASVAHDAKRNSIKSLVKGRSMAHDFVGKDGILGKTATGLSKAGAWGINHIPGKGLIKEDGFIQKWTTKGANVYNDFAPQWVKDKLGLDSANKDPNDPFGKKNGYRDFLKSWKKEQMDLLREIHDAQGGVRRGPRTSHVEESIRKKEEAPKRGTPSTSRSTPKEEPKVTPQHSSNKKENHTTSKPESSDDHWYDRPKDKIEQELSDRRKKRERRNAARARLAERRRKQIADEHAETGRVEYQTPADVRAKREEFRKRLDGAKHKGEEALEKGKGLLHTAKEKAAPSVEKGKNAVHSALHKSEPVVEKGKSLLHEAVSDVKSKKGSILEHLLSGKGKAASLKDKLLGVLESRPKNSTRGIRSAAMNVFSKGKMGGLAAGAAAMGLFNRMRGRKSASDHPEAHFDEDAYARHGAEQRQAAYDKKVADHEKSERDFAAHHEQEMRDRAYKKPGGDSGDGGGGGAGGGGMGLLGNVLDAGKEALFGGKGRGLAGHLKLLKRMGIKRYGKAMLKGGGKRFAKTLATGVVGDSLGIGGDLLGDGLHALGGGGGKGILKSGMSLLGSGGASGIKGIGKGILKGGAKLMAGKGMLGTALKVGKMGKGLLKGGALGVVGDMALDAADSGIDKYTKKGGVANRVGHTATAAGRGAMWGATIGSVIPGVGTAVGAGIGALAGMIYQNSDLLSKGFHSMVHGLFGKKSHLSSAGEFIMDATGLGAIPMIVKGFKSFGMMFANAGAANTGSNNSAANADAANKNLSLGGSSGDSGGGGSGGGGGSIPDSIGGGAGPSGPGFNSLTDDPKYKDTLQKLKPNIADKLSKTTNQGLIYAVWSTAKQFGAKQAADIVNSVFASRPNMSDDDLIKGIFETRSTSIGKGDRGKFTNKTQAGLTNANEMAMAKNLSNGSQAADFNTMYNSAGDQSSNSTDVNNADNAAAAAAGGTPANLPEYNGVGQATNMDRYMATIAMGESGGDASKTNPGGSATGLFQTIDSTREGVNKQIHTNITRDGLRDPRNSIIIEDGLIKDMQRSMGSAGNDPLQLAIAHAVGTGDWYKYARGKSPSDGIRALYGAPGTVKVGGKVLSHGKVAGDAASYEVRNVSSHYNLSNPQAIADARAGKYHRGDIIPVGPPGGWGSGGGRKKKKGSSGASGGGSSAPLSTGSTSSSTPSGGSSGGGGSVPSAPSVSASSASGGSSSVPSTRNTTSAVPQTPSTPSGGGSSSAPPPRAVNSTPPPVAPAPPAPPPVATPPRVDPHTSTMANNSDQQTQLLQTISSTLKDIHANGSQGRNFGGNTQPVIINNNNSSPSLIGGSDSMSFSNHRDTHAHIG